MLPTSPTTTTWVPGSNAADSDSIYAEGIRIPPVKIFQKGELVEDILNLILLNCRVNHIRRGDLNAQFACNRKGVQRVEDVCTRYGTATVTACMEELLDYSERKIRMALAEIPNGVHTFSDYLDSDGVGSGPIKLSVTVEIQDQDITLDFTDNPDQVKGAINLPLSALRAAVYYGVRSIVDPTLPAAQRVADMVFGAMSQVVPHKVLAGSNSSITGVYFGGVDPKTHEYYVYMETFGGGSGARFNKDGLSCVQVHMTNTSNLPIESMEIEFPYMVEQYTLVPDSGGPGKFRGGLSMSKDIRVLGHDSQFTIKADRQKTPPWGLFGGQPGLPGVITIYPGTDQEAVIDSKKSGTTLKSGGVLRCQMPGAGGYGNPLERDRALIVHDLEEGYITPESALRDYGLTEEDLAQIEVFGKT